MKAVLFFCLFLLCFCEGAFVKQSSIFEGRDENYSDSSAARFISQDFLSGIFSKEHYLIKAYLPESSSHLELFSHFEGFDLEDGIKLEFKREGKGLVINISAPGYPARVLFERENYFLNGGAELDLTVEAENKPNYGARVRIWENFVNRKGRLKERALALTEESLIADSFSKGLILFNKGKGLRWGVKLFRARLIEGARVSPRTL